VPDFDLRIEASGGAFTPQGTTLFVFVTLRILNRGFPSIAWEFGGTAIVGGVRREAPLHYLKDDTTMQFDDGTKFVLQARDAIYEKGLTRIDTGVLIRGWLVLEIPGFTKPEEFFVHGNSLEVTCKDYLGKVYVDSQELTGKGARRIDRYFPGSGGEIVPPCA